MTILGTAGLLGGALASLRDRGEPGTARGTRKDRAVRDVRSVLLGPVAAAVVGSFLALVGSDIFAGLQCSPTKMLELFGLGLVAAVLSRRAADYVSVMAAPKRVEEIVERVEIAEARAREVEKQLAATTGKGAATRLSRTPRSLEEAIKVAIANSDFLKRTLRGIEQDEVVRSFASRAKGSTAEVEAAIERMVETGELMAYAPDATHDVYRYSLASDELSRRRTR